MTNHRAERAAAEKRGRQSEALAAWLLRLKFYSILGRRVRTPFGEIDLIARAPLGPICFVEVKARSDELQASDAIVSRQQARIARAAAHYLSTRPRLARGGARYDVVSIVPGKLPRHLRDAWRIDD